MRIIILITVISMLGACSSLDKLLRKGEYEVIIAKYAESLEKNDPHLNYVVGEAFRKSNRVDKALPYYQKAIEDGDQQDEEINLHYAQSLKANQEYEQARIILEKYIKEGKDRKVKQMAETELTNLLHFEGFKEETTFFRIKNLEEINTNGSEYAPVFINNYLYFTSNREGGKVYKGTGTAFTDLYRVRSRGANITISTLERLDPEINHPDVNEGSIAVSASATSLIFAKGNTGKVTGNIEVNLYFTRYRNGQWLEPRPLSINDPNSWDSTPSLGPDGSTLYFSSTRPGGYGGSDLYSAKLNRRGRWVDVRNLGPEINSAGNEMFPHVSSDGTLYFSSNGHPGFGNLDIYKSLRTGGEIIVENLGAPMNSSADDFAFHEYNLTRGFFSSNRKGGRGDDDIYTFVNDDPNLKVVNYFLTGTTVSHDDGENEIVVSNSKVSLADANGNIIDQSFTGQDGKFRFRVYSEENYDLIGEKTDYFTTRSKFSTIGKSVKKDTLTEFITNVDFTTKIHLDRIVLEKGIVLNNIYYDLDKADIRPDAALVLDSLVMIMNDNPEIFIELGSHTDSRADDRYNLDLSWRRARSAVSHIIKNGIDPSRITAKGYGETILRVQDAVTEEEHQQNRRTEFKVLRYNPKNRDDLPPKEELDEYDRFFNDSGN